MFNFNSLEKGLGIVFQVRNQKFFRAGEISWNLGIFINILLKALR